MTSIEFATSDVRNAARFLNGDNFHYLTDETKQHILDGVRRGLCRVRDPLMYGGQSGVVPENVSRSFLDPFMDELKRLHDRDMETRRKPLLFAMDGLPDGFSVEWGQRLHHEDGRSHIYWQGTSEWHRERVMEADPGDRYYRVVGPEMEASDE